MEVIPYDLRHAVLAAGERLAGTTRAAAAATVRAGSFAGTQEAMAHAAQAAVFADALLGQLRARLNEMRAVTK